MSPTHLMSTGFVSLQQLVSGLPPQEKDFLSDVIRRDQNPDGTDKGILRRMQNEICRKCHADYKRKYPNKPFKIKCVGIYDTPDYENMQEKLKAEAKPGEPVSTIDEIREIYDPAFWSSKNMVVKNEAGDIVPFIPRWYQEEALRCTAPRKVDRWGRGMGKSICGIAAELHYACINKNTELIIVCPAQAQGQMWYDEILFQSDNSPQLKGMVMQKKQQPFYYIRLGNGAKIKIFTAGSKAGRGADAIRGQNPRRIRADEQDYLADKDYKAIMPLLRRFKNSTFHGSSTPTGLRGMYWKMCCQFLEYKEFYFPITLHPDWDTEQLNEEVCMQEAKTLDRYKHEFLAEFGDPAAGVFKARFVDAALKPYSYKTCLYDPEKRYFMGVDWNGKGTGTRIRVVEYDPKTRIRRVVAAKTIADENWTTTLSIDQIVKMNRDWHCEEVGIDAGFGFAQDELIRIQGQSAAPSEVDKKRLKFVKVIDFRAKLETNKLVPNRDPDSKYLPDDDDQLKRPTKPFMVEGCVMAFEGELVEFSAEDKLLEEQLRGYRVKNWTKSDSANVYETDAESGDHDLDAFMIAMLLIELKYGLWHTPETMRRLAQIAHVTGWGVPGSPQVAAPVSAAQKILAKQQENQIPSRATGQAPQNGPTQDQLRILHHMKNGGMYVAPVNAGNNRTGSRVPSRTSVFQGQTPRSFNNFQGGRFGRVM